MATNIVEDRVQPFTEAEFESLFRAHFRHVYNYARARVGPIEGEDVAAEVFQAAAVAWRDGRHSAVTPAWLISVAHNKVIDRWRRAAVRRSKLHLVRKAVEDELHEPEPTDLFGAATRSAVLEVLDQLQPNQRALLILHHVDGMSSKAIAAELEMSPAAVDSALARARKSFRRLYRDPEEVS